MVVLAIGADGAAARGSVELLDKILTINKKDVRALKYDAMMKEINEAKRPLIVRFLRRVDKELAREAMENINQREAKVDRDPEPPALSSKPSKSKSEYKKYFEPYFNIKVFETAYNSINSRKGRELFMILIKK